MNRWKELDQTHQLLVSQVRGDELNTLLKTLPSQVRTMGLVRTLEGLVIGKNAKAYRDTFQLIAPLLDLDPNVHNAVKTLEECDRRAMFAYHRRALAVVDGLATLHRVYEKLEKR